MKVLECGFGFRLGLLEGFGFWCGNYKFYVLRSIDGKLTLMSSFDINEKYNVSKRENVPKTSLRCGAIG